jgi:hypothetical protein
MLLLDNAPYDFVLNHEEPDLEKLKPFVHRTFNGDDCIQFIKCLRNIYLNHNGLEFIFSKHAEKDSLQKSISEFKRIFFEIDHFARTQKHVSDPLKNSAAKRLNIFNRIILYA